MCGFYLWLAVCCHLSCPGDSQPALRSPLESQHSCKGRHCSCEPRSLGKHGVSARHCYGQGFGMGTWTSQGPWLSEFLEKGSAVNSSVLLWLSPGTEAAREPLCSDIRSPGFQVRGRQPVPVWSPICQLCRRLSAEMFAELQSAALPARPGWGHAAAAEQTLQTAGRRGSSTPPFTNS